MKKKKLSNENLKISIRAQRFDGGRMLNICDNNILSRATGTSLCFHRICYKIREAANFGNLAYV